MNYGAHQTITEGFDEFLEVGSINSMRGQVSQITYPVDSNILENDTFSFAQKENISSTRERLSEKEDTQFKMK